MPNADVAKSSLYKLIKISASFAISNGGDRPYLFRNFTLRNLVTWLVHSIF